MKRKQLRFLAPQDRQWSPALPASLLLGLISIGAYFFHLRQLVGASAGELQTIASLQTLSGLTDNLLLLPYKVLTFGLLQLPIDDLVASRAAAAMLALLTVSLFFVLAKRWYGLINGSIASLLFAVSSWMLHTGRYGAGYSCLALLALGLIATTVWLNNTEKAGRALLVASLVYGLALYVPGGLWFVLASAIVCRRSLLNHLRQATFGQRLAAGLIGAIAAAGVLLTIVRDGSLLGQWLGLPATWPGVVDLLKQAALSVSGFVLRGPGGAPEVWLSHTPILDVASTVLLLFGVLFYWQHRRNPRTRLLVLFLAIGAALTALNGAAALSFLVPVVYLVLAGGLASLMHQWKKVFPHNPIAEVVSLAVLGVLVLCIAGFHSQRYFTAWRQSPATTEAYSRQAQPDGNLPYLIQ